jgi:hypothetical protein
LPVLVSGIERHSMALPLEKGNRRATAARKAADLVNARLPGYRGNYGTLANNG